MKIINKKIPDLTSHEASSIANLAARGFGHDADDETIYADTLAHLSESDSVVLAKINRELVGFSMLSSCLWRQRA